MGVYEDNTVNSSSNAQGLFFELIQIALGSRDALSRAPQNKEWKALYKEARRQSITGVLTDGIARLPEGQRPPEEVLMRWIGSAHLAELNAGRKKEASEEAVRYFSENGFACTLLKGISVGRYYPNPQRRQYGDVDIWLDGCREEINNFVKSHEQDGRIHGANYHHVHFHLFEDTETEVHIWPSYLSSPLRNKRLHEFSNLHRPTKDSYMPTLAFDRVYILLHCYRHLCGHGVGLRQIMDYYYVLRQGFTEAEREDAVFWIRRLGMGRFAAGLMWALRECFGLEDKYLLCAPDEKEGRFVMHEVLLTGNMGHGDKRHWGSTKTPLSRFFFNLRRDLYLARHYPQEALWQPFFSLWLYFWRLAKGLL